MPATTQDIATCGMFLFEGFRDYVNAQEAAADSCLTRIGMGATGEYANHLQAERDKLQERTITIEAHVGGAIEQAQMLGLWAERVAFDTDRYEFEHGNPDHPGVLAYDVWNPLGWWIAMQYAAGDWTDPTTITSGQYKQMLAALHVRLDRFHGDTTTTQEAQA